MDRVTYLRECRAFFDENLSRYFPRPIGCRTSAVKALEVSLGVKLPEAYSEYLHWMGRDYDGIFRGEEAFLADVEDNAEYLPELLAENDRKLDEGRPFLCFFMHEGYIASWFYTDELDETHGCIAFRRARRTQTKRRSGSPTG